jgi:uncharacterized beta-barrel protein YwiB (DUF1934 family)
MKKEVLLNITGVQGIDDNKETIEFSTVGTMETDLSGTHFYYDESQILKAGSIKTALNILNDGSVILERSGDLNTRLVLEQNKRNNCHYNTPFGDMIIGIYCNRLDVDLSGNTGRVFMDYSIDSNFREISKNEVTINIKEV